MIDDSTPPAPGQFTPAEASPVFFQTCPRCTRRHDTIGSRLWIKGTRLRICRHCVEERDELRAGRAA
jgi:hypothetical protein